MQTAVNGLGLDRLGPSVLVPSISCAGVPIANEIRILRLVERPPLFSL